MTNARVVMLQVEGPKVRTKGWDQWETTVLALVRVQGYLGCSGSTWNANPNMMILVPPHPNAPTIVTTCCHQHRAQIIPITISTNSNLLIPILPLITWWYITNHTTTSHILCNHLSRGSTQVELFQFGFKFGYVVELN